MERAEFWKGLAIGIAATALAAALVLIAALTVRGAGRAMPCPMCGTVPNDGMGAMPGWMMTPGSMDERMMRDMQVIHRLLLRHRAIERRVEEIPGGIRSETTSADPEVARLIRAHVRQMKARLEEGRPIRQMDPLFREIFRHRRAIRLQIEEIPGGVRVTETSEDPQVVLLIRQHARRAVSEFVEGGMERAMRPTPLPPGYRVPGRSGE